MSEDLVVRHCAPTLAGLKTGNIFNASYDSEEELFQSLVELNAKLESRGLKAVCLRCGDGTALIYLYRPQELRKDLKRSDVRKLLREFNYVPNDPDSCIARLADRITRDDQFPHEIGLFLGYPPEDVEGFIACRGRNCKTCGYWKVYGDAQAAEKQFTRFRKCTDVYMKCLRCGATLQKLAVRKRNQM